MEFHKTYKQLLVGYWYICITCALSSADFVDPEKPLKPIDQRTTLGIDRGCNNTIATSESIDGSCLHYLPTQKLKRLEAMQLRSSFKQRWRRISLSSLPSSSTQRCNAAKNILEAGLTLIACETGFPIPRNISSQEPSKNKPSKNEKHRSKVILVIHGF